MPAVVRFGPYELDLRTHELRKHGLAVQLRPQSARVLAALLEAPGELVTRDELKARLWPGVRYADFENGLNSAVNRLREALGDSADQPRYIETLARQGYRFIAPVAHPVFAETPAAPPVLVLPPAAASAPAVPPEPAGPVPPPPPSKRKLRRWVDALAAIAALILIAGLWPPPQPTARVTPLTSDARWKYPVLLVSDGRVLYTAGVSMGWLGNDFWSVPTAGGEPRREPKPCATEVSSPYLFAVSYPHRRLLVQCQEPVDRGTEAQFWLVGFDHAQAKWIGRWGFLDEPVSISPDLQTLLFNDKDSVFVKPMEGGRQRLVVRVDRSAPIDMAGVGWHPSGTRITVSRWMNGLRKLWEVRADGTGLRPLLPGFASAQDDWTWSPDGRRLYFTSGGDIYLLGRSGWLGWMHRPTPVRLTSGPTQFGPPFEDPANPLTAYAQGAIPQVAAMKLNRKTNVFEPFLGGIQADCVEYSPDGQWIVFVKRPSRELWKCRKDGSGKTLLLEGLQCGNPRWSPDGTRIAFSARKGGLWDSSQQSHIYTIRASGGQPEPVPGVPGPAIDPTWSPDGKQLAFAPFPFERTEEQQHVSIVNLETGAVEAVPHSDGMWSTRWSPDGNWLAALGPDGLVVYRFRTGNWTVLGPRGVGYPRWSKDSRYVYGLISKPVITLIRIPVAASRKEEEIRRIPEFILEWGAYWTPDDEPIVLRDLTAYQIYRIDRDR